MEEGETTISLRLTKVKDNKSGDYSCRNLKMSSSNFWVSVSGNRCPPLVIGTAFLMLE